MRRVAVDFETEAIVGNPIWQPPKPIGVAVYEYGSDPVYTTDFSIVDNLWADPSVELVFHNAPFDTRVAQVHLGLPIPYWNRVHDTQFLLFLDDPYSKSLALKPAAERYLAMPNDEQDELHDWIVANIAGATAKSAGAFISLAPMALVSRYAKGDVTRTLGLFNKLHPNTATEAYDRERKLSPILVSSTARGVRVDRETLARDAEVCAQFVHEADRRIQQILGKEFNVGSTAQLGDALYEADMVTEWVLTPTGQRSTAKKNIKGRIKDKELERLIEYRSTAETCVGTFMRPWVELASQDGRVHPEWHQTRDNEEGSFSGTRTGRMSCSDPNLQNPPNVLDIETPQGFPPLPVLRKYLLPEEGHVWLKRDFSSQEVRILAHFEEGALAEAYRADPSLDPHEMARGLIIENTGLDFPRKKVKITGFQIIYGGGPNAIAGQVGCPLEEATTLRNAYLASMPGVKTLQGITKRRGDAGQPIRTWGGRYYFVEPPKMVRGQRRNFSYKLLNYLIQGSAADQTKQCIIDWHERYNCDSVLLAAVHDEINISAPKDSWQHEMRQLKAAMNQDLFDVPMLSEGFVGPSWGEVEEYGV